jgi:hypothetical protein
MWRATTQRSAVSEINSVYEVTFSFLLFYVHPSALAVHLTILNTQLVQLQPVQHSLRINISATTNSHSCTIKEFLSSNLPGCRVFLQSPLPAPSLLDTCRSDLLARFRLTSH